MKAPALALTLCLTTPAVAEDANWHLFVQTFGGAASVLHGLTDTQCLHLSRKLRGLPTELSAIRRENASKEFWGIHEGENEGKLLQSWMKQNPGVSPETICKSLASDEKARDKRREACYVLLGQPGSWGRIINDPSPDTAKLVECFQ